MDDDEYALQPIAEKRGFAVYRCDADAIPSTPVRRKIGRWVLKLSREHMIVFKDASRTGQSWQ